MKKIVIVAFFALIASFISAQKANLPAGKTDWGLFFSMNGLTAPFSPENDGYQSGASVKYWFDKNIALKALLSVDGNYPAEGDAQTIIGLGVGGEYHPVPGVVSPFIGALAGARFLMELENSVDLYAGIDAGVEVMLYKNISLTAEYEFLFYADASGLNIEGGKTALVSLGIYF